MSKYAMLTLDLDSSATSEQRQKFYAFLAKENWTKVPKITTTWYASFQDTATEQGMVGAAKSDVEGAAKHSGVFSYDAMVHAGQSKPTAF